MDLYSTFAAWGVESMAIKDQFNKKGDLGYPFYQIYEHVMTGNKPAKSYSSADIVIDIVRLLIGSFSIYYGYNQITEYTSGNGATTSLILGILLVGLSILLMKQIWSKKN